MLPNHPVRPVALALATGLLVAACSIAAAPTPTPRPSVDPTACAGQPMTGDHPGWPQPSREVVPVIVSSQLGVGPSRFLFTITDGSNRLIAARDAQVEVSVYDLATDPRTPVASVPATYYDAGNGRGLYHAWVTFRCSGDWGARFEVRRPGSMKTSAGAMFTVWPTTTVPAIGDPAPRSETPTADDAAGIAAISTDATPDPDFYRSSIADAVTSGQPSLIVFATPAFCQTAVCGPALDMVQTVAADYRDRVTFVHVEPYLLKQTENGLQPDLKGGRLQPVPALKEWGLLTEPYIFVVDAQGNVSAGFEGMAGADELRAALDAVTASD